jgi:hypothetical protein
MTINYSHIIEAVSRPKVRRATYYHSPTFIVNATRKTYGGKIMRGNIEISLTIGKPNYAQRDFISKCKKANEPFPVKKIQLKFVK